MKDQPKASEAQVLAACLQVLEAKKKNLHYWRNNTGALKTEKGGFVRFGSLGSPDIFVVIGGQCFGLECKSTIGKQSDNQKAWQKKFENAGGIYYIIRSTDDLLEKLDDFK